MVSSFAAQLAQGVSLNASLSVGSSRRKHTESYLFSAKEAAQHDLDSLHALGVNGFMQLKSMNPSLRHYEHALFSDAAKATDRTLQAVDANAKLDEQIAAFLPLLGPFLMDAPTGKVLEWLVRRFRINEFNVKDALALFLPYHESPHFAKMVSILHISDQAVFRFLLPYKSKALSLPRSALVTEMSKNSDFARFILDLLPKALREDAGPHRTLVAFHTGLSLDFIAHQQTLNESTIAFLLPAFLEPLQLCPNAGIVKPTLVQESILGNYLLLAAASQKCNLSSKALKAILLSISSVADRVSPKQYVRTLVAVCAPQNELEDLPRTVIATILQTSGIDEELKAGLLWVGAEKFITPLLTGLVKHLDYETSTHLFDSILTSAEVSPSIVRHATAVLLRRAIEDEVAEDSQNVAARRSLSQIQQRHLKIFEQACQDAMKRHEDQREAIEQVILSLTVVSSIAGNIQDLGSIVASISADENARAIAVRDLLKMLSSVDLSHDDRASITSTLLSRVKDTSATVIEALYAQPTVLLPILLENAAGYISSLFEALHSKQSSVRDLIRLHLSFVTQHFFSLVQRKNAELARTIVYQVYFPFIFFSKPRQKTASLVWNILEERDKDHNDSMGIARHELLGGCVDAVRWEQAKQDEGEQDEGGYRHVEQLTKVNLALTSRLADNVAVSNNFDGHLDALLALLHNGDLHARNLSYLVIRALLGRLSTERQLSVAYRVLQAMKLGTLEGMSDFMRGADNLQAFLHDMSLVTAVVLKPSSQHTKHRLQVSLLNLLANIPRPSGVVLNWLVAPQTKDAQNDVHLTGVHYVQVMRAVYKLSNSTSSLPLLSTHILRTLFINLGDEALAFLAGVWVSTLGVENDNRDHHLCHAALRHAVAFLDAHCAIERWVDFQTILPSIMVCLQSSDRRVREEATACLVSLGKVTDAKQVSAVYAYDKIYGTSSGDLQYLEQYDFRKYADALIATSNHFVHDESFVSKFNAQHLSERSSDSKKDAGYKQRVMCYILSHVNACPLLDVRLSLLKSVESVTNEIKSQVLLPTLQKVLDELRGGDLNVLHQDFAALTVSSLDVSSAVDLNDQSKPSWSTFERALKACFSESGKPMRLALASNIQNGLFIMLSGERKVELCRTLLEIGSQQPRYTLECKQLLTRVVTEVSLMIQLLVSLQPTSLDSGERASKRARLDDTSQADNAGALSSLSLLAEVLISRSLPGSLDLIICLLETLNKVFNHAETVSADKSYVEELLMTALDSAICSMPDASNIPAGAIRIDVLVELIRVSENPRTSHQALLVMSSLTRLIPDAVLHNVMPVFTFMGFNVFHRDDSYSFRVVQKTVDSIVPVMAASLKGAHADRLELYLASRDFLRIFTDASNHMPRHRRAHIFSHLVDVLGPEEFLPPVCMLLVDRIANRVVRQSAQDAQASLSLPLTLVQHYPAEQRLSALVNLMHEVQRLLGRRHEDHPAFLDTPLDDDLSPTIIKRRALALLLFADYALKDIPVLSSHKSSRERSLSSDLLSLLLSFTALGDEDSVSHLTVAARAAMAGTLRLMSAVDFVAGILPVLETSEVTVKIGALELLADRLASVSDSVRREVTPTIVKIVDLVRRAFSMEPGMEFVRAAFHALRSISQTTCSGEEIALTSTVPFVLHAAKLRETSSVAFSVLQSLCVKLGPRIIPHLKETIQVCIKALREMLSGDWSDIVDKPTDAFAVIHGLLSAIPTFWSDQELVGVIHLYLEYTVTAPSTPETVSMTSIVKSLAKQVPSKTLLPTLCNMWLSLKLTEVDSTRCIGFFSVMKRSVRAASRTFVLDHIRPLCRTFQDAFDTTALVSQKDAETAIISTFTELVVKLNETAFRPLFRKLCDWAFANDNNESCTARQVTFCHVYTALLDYFKVLMVPYMSFIWQPLVQLFGEYTTGSLHDSPLWTSAMQTVTKSLTYDEGLFWKDNKLRELVSILNKQIPVCVRFNVAAGKTALLDCLTATMGAIEDDALMKTMNLNVLMHSRSEDTRLRLFSLTCSEALWRTHGGKLLGFTAETITFIAECAEDENDDVIREVYHLKKSVESVAGRIDVV